MNRLANAPSLPLRQVVRRFRLGQGCQHFHLCQGIRGDPEVHPDLGGQHYQEDLGNLLDQQDPENETVKHKAVNRNSTNFQLTTLLSHSRRS